MISIETITSCTEAGRCSALTRVSLQVSSGRIAGVLGQGGSGKSALAAVLAGMLPLESGSVRGANSGRPRCAVIPQGEVIWPASAEALWRNLRTEHSVNVAVQTWPCGLLRANAEPRLLLAQILAATRPEALVIDEPELLSPESMVAWRQQLRQFAAELPVLVLSRHEVVLAACCDDLHILFDGRMIASGSLADLAPGALALARRRYPQ